MKKLRMPLIVATALSAIALMTVDASAGCARWGETGYHFYRSCAGPGFLYPHHRRCTSRHGLCVYH
jgi:hypothetical protein